ncbi:MAG: hypothetical protein IKW74_02670, partial [Thermoguttaceae bacterium]|nr:hypothetical protein [Thermoguttaceae bacterium]
PNFKRVDESQVKFVRTTVTWNRQQILGTAIPEHDIDNGIYVRTVTGETKTDLSGCVDELGDNVNFIHEWQTHYAELWINANEYEKYTAAGVTFHYDSTYFTAVSVEFGTSFSGEASVDADSGTVTLNGRANGDYAAGSGYILIARIKMESLEGQGIDWIDSNRPFSVGWSLSDGYVTTLDGNTQAVYLGNGSTTELWANPYDVNDDNIVNVLDYLNFGSVYDHSSLSGESILVACDFNRDGQVNVLDYMLLGANYDIAKQDVVSGKYQLAIAKEFIQRYTGSRLNADHQETIGTILDAANDTWIQALNNWGQEQQLDMTVNKVDVQLIVKDLSDISDGTTLAETVITKYDSETGLPVRGIIYLDEDAATMTWYSQLSDPESGTEKYDLYTVLLHELGHMYGYDANCSAFNTVRTQFSFIASDDHSTTTEDVMSSALECGERKTLSDQDIQVVGTVYAWATGLMNPETVASLNSNSNAIRYDTQMIEEEREIPLLSATADTNVPWNACTAAETEVILCLPEATAVPNRIEIAMTDSTKRKLANTGINVRQAVIIDENPAEKDVVLQNMFPEDNGVSEDRDPDWPDWSISVEKQSSAEYIDISLQTEITEES